MADIIDAFIVPLPNGSAGSVVLELACGAVRGDLLSGGERQRLAEHVSNGRWADKSDIALFKSVVTPADLAAHVDEAAADELAVLPVSVVEFDGGVSNRPSVDRMHSDTSSVGVGITTVAEAGGAATAPGGGPAA